MALVALTFSTHTAFAITEDEEKQEVAKIIGPEISDNNCATCHAVEVEAWKQSHHFATFATAHTTDRAKEILKNMGQRSMKRSTDCRQCHYTSLLKGDNLVASWGVSCESCHGGGRDWNEIHNKIGDQKVTWGMGKKQDPAARAARLEAAVAKGMIHADMLYDIAINCFSCHTVPNEELVNKGKHLAGSEFDLVAWSQGEVRHNFASSPGAPDAPTNRAATQEQLRRMHVVGALADLEVSLRNLANVKEKGGDFHKAMIDRVNARREKVAKILGAAELPGVAAALKQVPEKVDASTMVTPAAADAIAQAGRQFVKEHDGSKLAGLDPMIPKEFKGTPYKG
jgi:hypothetical protein